MSNRTVAEIELPAGELTWEDEVWQTVIDVLREAGAVPDDHAVTKMTISVEVGERVKVSEIETMAMRPEK